MTQINTTDTFNTWRLAHNGLDSDYRAFAAATPAITVNDTGGLGALSYNGSNGVITYVGASNSDIRSLFSVGPGIITYDSATGQFTSTDVVTATDSGAGVAAFSADNFLIDAGVVSIKVGGVDSDNLTSNAVTTTKIANDAVTYAKIQNVGTANRVLGSTSAGGIVSEVQVQTNMIANVAITQAKIANDAVGTGQIEAQGANEVLIFDASGDPTASKISANNINSNAVTTAKINNDAVTYAKIQNVVTANRVLGSTSAGGIVSEVQVQTNMVADDAITRAKLANEVSLVVYNSGGSAVKTLYGAGS